MANDEKVSTSSIVMKAIDAQTFSEMQTFVKDLESRPVERLLRDLPELVKVSESKSSIVSYVVATKYRHADAEAQKSIAKALEEMFARVPEGEERERISLIQERIRALSS